MNKKDLEQIYKLLEEQEGLTLQELEKLQELKERIKKLKRSRVQSLKNKKDL